MRNNLFSAQELATIRRKIEDWIHENAYFIAMPLRDESDVNAYIGEQVRCARLAKGLSKYRLAKSAGVSDNTIYNVEDGKNSPSVMLLYKIAAVLETVISIQ